jgi:hypothetical protein
LLVKLILCRISIAKIPKMRVLVKGVDLFLLVFSFLSLVEVSNAQNGVVFELNATTGLVYLLLTIIFLINFVTPMFMWVYSNYLEVYFELAAAEASKMSKRVSERISDAGRKVSEQMR